MPVNWTAVFVSALIPMATGFLWYHPKLLGGAWMKGTGLTEEDLKRPHPALLYGLALLFSVMIAISLAPMVIHQMGAFSLAASDPGMGTKGSEIDLWLKAYMEKFGDKHRSFGHGALHGAIAGLFFAVPVLTQNALFERRGWKLILINSGYWILTLTLMGAVICGWR